MTDLEAWIADCHLLQIEGEGEYRCQAAVWTDSAAAFRSGLATHLESRGFKILWLEECLPANQYIQRHGQQKKIGELARVVHPEHLVELSQMAALDDGVEAEPESYLIIEEIEGVEPLDQQFGVHPKKNVPDALREPLFGKVEPTEVEIELYGSAEAIPPMKTYAILDAAKVLHLPAYLKTSGLKFQCLFQGKSAEELKNVAPYLVELEEENTFTRNLFTSAEMPSNMWDKEPGIYIRSRAEFDEVRKHLRKFTRIQDENAKWFLFRFWDAHVSGFYFRNIDAALTEHKLSCMFSGLIDNWIAVTNGSIAVFSTRKSSEKAGGVFRIDQNDYLVFSELSWQKYLKKLLRVLANEHPETLADNTENGIFVIAGEARAQNFRTEIAVYNYVRSHLVAAQHGFDIAAVIRHTAGGSPTEHARHMWKEIRLEMEKLN